ncbi:hypothetical protein JKP88DRAFT_197319 [Tribonema minus]|uniref:Uncharacterized protein n=1 Tax=Tribonema minus TaxID=303371 RepID=A0A836CM66_9STRA|nr:hypothetical protein JKP88DRAFT_197319 [Tribonema minus]|eukprot:TRINITY_DN19897_c0_g1_i1.p1 TRINITY_DN19897_c0_g1~~TRINITY_DN19897_c0_g1_i1.p1  ORF type:complete len:176 (-),score=71.29 TRINITY_DN19897_c0_g1_i1:262-789(-)
MGIRDNVCAPCARNPQKAIAYAWFTSIILVAIAFVCACVAASKQEGVDAVKGSKSLAFASIWTALLLILLCIGGSMVMRRYRTSLAVGFFLGVVIIMSQQMLILFAVFAGRAEDTTNDSEKPADSAFAAFCFFLFVVYTGFAIMLAMFRADIIADTNTSTKYDGEADLPHNSVGV